MKISLLNMLVFSLLAVFFGQACTKKPDNFKPRSSEKVLKKTNALMHISYQVTAQRNFDVNPATLGNLDLSEINPRNERQNISMELLPDGQINMSIESQDWNKKIVIPLFRLPWNIVNNISTDSLCELFIDDRFVARLSQTTDVTLQDLAVGSSAIQNINDYTDNVNPNIPRITIWAEENSPVHWRLMSTEMFGDDIRFVRIMRNIRGVYNAYYIMNLSSGAIFTIAGFFDPANFIAAALFYYRASQWKKGRDWFDDSENIWNALIGSTRREPHEFWELVFVPDPDYDDCMEHYENEEYPWPGDCGHWEWQWVTRMVSVNYPSDGLLPKYTQVLQNIPPDNIYKVEGANHLEVTNMSNSPQGDITKQRFEQIFGRNDWFHTN